jgi:hypothetical protein
MSAPTEDDLDNLPEAELLALPGEAIPPGRLTAFFVRRAALLHQHELDELAFERSGNSARHFLIFPDTDPKQRERREEDARRRAWLAEQEMLEYRQGTDRLLAQIEDQQRVIEKRRKEIEDNAIRLHDGRHAYVDGDQYRDEGGRLLEGRDHDEAADQHRLHPDASTWQERQKTIDQAGELERLKQKILKDGGEGAPEEKLQTLSGYQQEFQQQIEARAQQAPVDYGSADYMAAYGDDYKLSTVPAFTRAAIASHETTVQSSDTETESDTAETKNAPRPTGQGVLKPG